MTLEQLNICATFIATLSALIIFLQWRKQKGSEVLSNLSLSIDNKLYHIVDIYNDLELILINIVDLNLDKNNQLDVINRLNNLNRNVSLIVSDLKKINKYEYNEDIHLLTLRYEVFLNDLIRKINEDVFLFLSKDSLEFQFQSNKKEIERYRGIIIKELESNNKTITKIIEDNKDYLFNYIFYKNEKSV